MKYLSNGLIATASLDSTVKLWQSLSNKPYVKLIRTLSGHKGTINSLKEVNASVLASGGCDGSVLLWDVNTGALLKTIQVAENDYRHCIFGLTMLSDGRLATAVSYDSITTTISFSNITFWNLNNFTSSLFATLPSFIYDLSLTLNGSVLAVSTNNNCDDQCDTSANPTHDRGSIWLFFIADPTQVFVLGDTGLPNDQDLTDRPDFIHTNGVGRIYPISDFILASASKDKTVKLWNLTSLADTNPQAPVTLRCQFKGALAIDRLKFNGVSFLITGSHDGLINAYDLTQGSTYGNLMSSFNGGLDVGAMVVTDTLNDSNEAKRFQ